uniref:Uncharacterized protein n=1 Tax=Anguilla anguilla TaxID=7936 RepID=A0A0E9VPU7_ANGAN
MVRLFGAHPSTCGGFTCQNNPNVGLFCLHQIR